MGKVIDLVGKQFGELTVIRQDLEKKSRRAYWVCQCSCGNISSVLGTSLRSGNTKSCGCMKYSGLKKYNEEQSEKSKIALGTRFGKLTVIEDLGLLPAYNGALKNRRWYRCKCDCGNVKDYNSNSLKNGDRVSCGCIMSIGEYHIKDLLDKNGIRYLHDSEIQELTNNLNRRLRFDFILTNEKNEPIRCIEFDGNQHKTGMWGGTWSNTETFEQIHERDILKNKWCLENKIPLVRIPYSKKDNLTIEDLLTDIYLVKGDD